MRTTLNIEDDLFADLMRLTHATTKTQAVRDALKEYIRLRRKEELLALRGRFEIEDNWRQLRESELKED
jgi:Arc/MetJ family transcription regulator